MMSNDWDLYEFLGSSAGHSAGGGCGAKDGFLNHDSFSFPYHHDPFDKTFHRQSPGHPIASPSAAAGGLGEKLPHFLSLHQRQLQMLKDHNEKHRIGFQALAARLRRKEQTTLEVRLKVKMLPKDSWSWRKYGQKPIKGSPHPRSYYRCSSSKACAARKQVELSQDNPDEYIVSYFGNHTHARPPPRRSAAGTAKNPSPPCSVSPTTIAAAAAGTTCLAPISAPPIVVTLDEENEQNDAEDDDDVILIPNNQIAEELFMAMHGFRSAESLSPANNSGGN